MTFSLMYLQQHLFTVVQLAALEERAGQVEQHLRVLVLVELLQAVLVLLWGQTRATPGRLE